MITASALADALIATLTTKSASVFDSASRTGNITKNDFGILDTTTSACMFFVFPGPFQNDPLSFNNTAGNVPHSRTQTFKVLGAVKDTGNVITTLNNVWKLPDDIDNALSADDTLGGSAMFAYLARGDGWDDTKFLAGQLGVAWAYQTFDIEVFVE